MDLKSKKRQEKMDLSQRWFRAIYANFNQADKFLLWLAAAAILIVCIFMVDASRWEAVGALGAAVAAAFAGGQIYFTRTEARRRTTFEHIREITNFLQPLWRYDASDLQQKVLRYYMRESDAFPEEAMKYLAFLDAVDLLALGIETQSVDREVALEYLQTLFRSNLTSVCFVKQLQDALGDDKVYSHLEHILGSSQSLGVAHEQP